MALNKITGRVEITVNNKVLLSKTGAVASGIGISGKSPFEREAVMGDTGILGYTEKPVVAQLEVTITDSDSQLLSDFIEKTNLSVVFQTAGGGKSYTMSDAFCTGNLSVTSGEGDVPLKFIGSAWTEATTTTA